MPDCRNNYTGIDNHSAAGTDARGPGAGVKQEQTATAFIWIVRKIFRVARKIGDPFFVK